MSIRSAGKVSLTLLALSAWMASASPARLGRRYSPDAVQDAVLAVVELEQEGKLAFDASGTLESMPRRLAGYLHLCVRRCHQAQRKRDSRFVPGTTEDCDTLLSCSPSPEEQALLRHQLEHLPFSDEEIMLAAGEELVAETDDQLAERLGISTNTLHKRRSRLRERCGQSLTT